MRRALIALAVLGAAFGTVGLANAGGAPRAKAARHAVRNPYGIGIAPGKIKHVWLIILENKS